MLTPPTITPRMKVSTAGRVRSLMISAIMQNNAEKRIGQGGVRVWVAFPPIGRSDEERLHQEVGGETRDAAQLNLVRFCLLQFIQSLWLSCMLELGEQYRSPTGWFVQVQCSRIGLRRRKSPIQ